MPGWLLAAAGWLQTRKILVIYMLFTYTQQRYYNVCSNSFLSKLVNNGAVGLVGKLHIEDTPSSF